MNETVYRVYELSKGGRISIYKPNEGSLFYVRMSDGKNPEFLNGAFTGIREADSKVKSYISNFYKTPRTSKNIKENVEEKQKIGIDMPIDNTDES